MKRKIAIALLIGVCFLLQSTVFQTLSLASISPNLLLIITASLGFLRGEKEGLFVGFFSGLLVDVFFWGTVWILCAFVYVYRIRKRHVSHDVL